MNTDTTKAVPEPSNPDKRTSRTHRKERTVPHRKRRRMQRLLSDYRNKGDTAARDAIYRDHLHIAELYARRYAGRGVDYDDLLQEASLGLLKAIERYDPAREAAFSTYASCMIEGNIKQYFRDKAWPCTVPRKVKSHVLQIRNMEQKLGRKPTKQEVVDAGLVPPDQADAALIASQAWATVCLSQDDVATTEPRGARSLAYVEPEYELTSNFMDMEAAMRKLNQEEMNVARMYYFGHLSQKEIAQSIGASPMHVSRLLRKATRNLGPDFLSMYRAS